MSICSSVKAFLEGAKEAYYEHRCETGTLTESMLNRQTDITDRYWRCGTKGEHFGATLGSMTRPAYFLLERKNPLEYM